MVFKKKKIVFEDRCSGKIQRVCVNNTTFFLNKRLRVVCNGIKNFEKGESVSICKLNDPDLSERFIMVSNGLNVVWVFPNQVVGL